MRPATNRPAATAIRVLVCLAVAGAPGPAAAHPHSLPPPLSYDLKIQDSGVTGFLLAEVPVLEMWRRGAWRLPVGADETRALLDALVPLLAQHVEVRIDGVAVPPEGMSLVPLPAILIEGVPRANDMVSVKVRYPTAVRPRTVHLLWVDFSVPPWEGEIQVPSLIEAPDGVIPVLLDPREPEYTWHPRPAATDWTVPYATPPAGPEPSWGLPFASLLLLLASGAVLVRHRGPRGLAVAAALALGAFLARGVVLGIPTGERRLPSSREAAAALFEERLAGLYGAFDAASEEDVRAGLLGAAEAPLADALFPSIREDLTLRDRGGVTGRVERVETLDQTVVLPDEAWAGHFDVEWYGRIHIEAEHHAHRHRRVQERRARYGVRYDDGAWRIHGVLVHEELRIDEDAEGRLPVLGPAEDDR